MSTPLRTSRNSTSPNSPKPTSRPKTPSLSHSTRVPKTPNLRKPESEDDSTDSNSGNIKVVVRVRPFVTREKQAGLANLVSMNVDDHTVKLYKNKLKDEKESKTYSFDDCVWSFNDKDSHYVGHELFYGTIGKEFLKHTFDGYNTCLLTYGQTGSGKTYTMMGNDSQPGITPMICKDFFKLKEDLSKKKINCGIKLSFYEIYNEQVRDLLVDSGSEKVSFLKIRESPTSGPYVENLSEFNIASYQEILNYLNKGNLNRATAFTKMNDESSRSHAILTISLKQTKHNLNTKSIEQETISSMKLVDLAGSERNKSTEAKGERLKEGSNINKSLTTLGRCISILSSNNQINVTRSPKKQTLVPYRDSSLTWLLKESLSGNSKTVMIACISPTDYEETLSTLRYANEVKKIKTIAKVNQNKQNLKEIENLQKEIDKLKFEILNHQAEKEEELETSNKLKNLNKLIQFLEDQLSQETFMKKMVEQEYENCYEEFFKLNNQYNGLLNIIMAEKKKLSEDKTLVEHIGELEILSSRFKENLASDLARFDPSVILA